MHNTGVWSISNTEPYCTIGKTGPRSVAIPVYEVHATINWRSVI